MAGGGASPAALRCAPRRPRTPVTTPAATATTTDGRAVPAPPASRPPSVGPTIVPADEQTTAIPTRPPSPPSCVSQAAPPLHSIPKPRPTASRPASSTASIGSACAAQPTAISTPAPSVTRCAPTRSASTPAGIDAASIARPGSASTSAVSELDSPSAAASRGSSGTIAVEASPETKNRAQTTRASESGDPLPRRGRRRPVRSARSVSGVVSIHHDVTIFRPLLS